MAGNWGEVVTRYPYRKVRMDHLLSKEPAFAVMRRTVLDIYKLLVCYLVLRDLASRLRGFVFFDNK